MLTPEQARQLFPFLVAVSVGAGAFVLWRMLYAIKTFIDNAVDSASGKSVEELSARAWYQKPCATLLLHLGGLAILIPLCLALIGANIARAVCRTTAIADGNDEVDQHPIPLPRIRIFKV